MLGEQTLSENLKSLTEIYTGEELRNLIQATEESRSPENASKLALEIYTLVSDQAWFVLGYEHVWEATVLTMQKLAEESANAGSADGALLAGVIAGQTWAIGGSVSGPDMGAVDLARNPIITADHQKALAWFEKGAAIGDELCAKNVEIARGIIAKHAAASPPPEAPRPL